MPVRVRYYTDPACSASWAAEPALRRLMVEFGPDLHVDYVMGGLAREYSAGDAERLVIDWLDAADRSGMPVDPRLWGEGPIRSTYPACMAVKAASEQTDDGGYRYLRALREGLMCFRRKLDTTEALVEEARQAGLDAARFRIDLESHATVEAFGRDLDAVRAVPDEARAAGEVVSANGGERLTFPTLAVLGEDGGTHWAFGAEPYESWRHAVLAAAAEPSDQRPGVIDALRRFGRMAAAEVEAVCDLPGPRGRAELWQLATEWRARPVRVLFGELWELAG
jgi:predicted DsbA family dithiol-disulfide isomerase